MFKSVKIKLKKALKMTDLGTITNILSIEELKYNVKMKPEKFAFRNGNI